jgi:NADH:ubiquinone oxidoreductase subunit 6 (subunit J)
MTYIVFGFFGILTLGGGILVVTSRNLVRAAASLVLSLFGRQAFWQRHRF